MNLKIPNAARLAILTVLAIALLWWRSQKLSVQRTIVANLPSDINRLVVTDLDEDGEPELVVYCASMPLKGDLTTFTLPYFSETKPETWLVRYPLKIPRMEKLPYDFRMFLPAFLPPLRKLLVEKIEPVTLLRRKYWQSRELGWLRMRNGKFIFENLTYHHGLIRCRLAKAGGLVNIFVKPEPSSISGDKTAKHYGFRITTNGDWQPINFVGWKGRRVYWYGMEYFGDFDGDKIVDLLKFSSAWNKPSRLEVYWGDGKKTTTLVEGYGVSSEAIVDDFDSDGIWEIVWDGRIWKLSPYRKGFMPIASICWKAPSLLLQQKVLPKQPQIGKFAPMLSMPPFPFGFNLSEEIVPIDLDGDGHKEFMVFWRKSVPTDIPPFPKPELVAVQVVWLEGQNWKAKEFKPAETKISSKPSAVFELDGQRFAIANETYHRIRLRFPIVSLRPLRFRFWERETMSRTTLFRLPKGKEAFDLKRWKKVAHLPTTPILVGDWDGDGRVEMLMRQKFWGNKQFQYGEPKPVSETLYLARFDGKKFRLAKLTPPKLIGAISSISSVAIVKGKRDAAIFVLWDRTYESVLERLKWR